MLSIQHSLRELVTGSVAIVVQTVEKSRNFQAGISREIVGKFRGFGRAESSGARAGGANRKQFSRQINETSEQHLFAFQLALNLGWSLLFFGLRDPGLALAEVVAFWLAIAATTRAFWRLDRLAGLLMLPYLAWVAFAALLNAAIWRMN